MKLPEYSENISHWLLDRNTVFLNHGSFGACPSQVLEYKNKLTQQIENQPVKFLIRELESKIQEALLRLSEIIHADANDIVFVRNATEGVNTVLNNIRWNSDDRILITDHTYPACRNAVYHYAYKNNIPVDCASIPYPFQHESQITDAIVRKVRANTRLVLLDHISSPSAIVFPIQKIAEALSDRDVEILVDGAHAPGAIHLNIKNLGIHYYTGNCHKWLCSPRGAAFLYVDPHLQVNFIPLNVSLINMKNQEFQDRFFWTGTNDPTAQLSVQYAIETLESIAKGNLEDIYIMNKELNLQAAYFICDALNIPMPCPEHMLSCMTSFPLRDATVKTPIGMPDPLQERLLHEYGIEVPIFTIDETGQRFLRISCHLYNSIQQYEYLAEALKKNSF